MPHTRDPPDISYDCDFRKVRIYGDSYEAWFPAEHSQVEGLVCHTINDNYGEPFGTIPHWIVTCYVKWKGKRGWEDFDIIEHAKKEGYQFTNRIGIDNLLLTLEKPEVREAILKKAKIAELRRNIRDNKKELAHLVAA